MEQGLERSVRNNADTENFRTAIQEAARGGFAALLNLISVTSEFIMRHGADKGFHSMQKEKNTIAAEADSGAATRDCAGVAALRMITDRNS